MRKLFRRLVVLAVALAVVVLLVALPQALVSLLVDAVAVYLLVRAWPAVRSDWRRLFGRRAGRHGGLLMVRGRGGDTL